MLIIILFEMWVLSQSVTFRPALWVIHLWQRFTVGFYFDKTVFQSYATWPEEGECSYHIRHLKKCLVSHHLTNPIFSYLTLSFFKPWKKREKNRKCSLADSTDHTCKAQRKGDRQGRQRKRWKDNIREWTGLEFGRSKRAVENREKWRKLAAKSSVVPQQPSWLQDRWWWWWQTKLPLLPPDCCLSIPVQLASSVDCAFCITKYQVSFIFLLLHSTF